MKNKDKDDAPNFWIDTNETEERIRNSEQNKCNENKSKNDEKFADSLISTSSNKISCDEHETSNDIGNEILQFDKCKKLKEKVEKYQGHKHTFTCAKKIKTVTIKENEGHGYIK
jgi:hypothetical protein